MIWIISSSYIKVSPRTAPRLWKVSLEVTAHVDLGYSLSFLFASISHCCPGSPGLPPDSLGFFTWARSLCMEVSSIWDSGRLRIFVLSTLIPIGISSLYPRFRVTLGRSPQEVSACEEQGLRPGLELPTLDVNTAQHRPYTDFLALFCSSKAGPRWSLQYEAMRTPENASPLIQGLQCLREAWMLKPCRPHRILNENN